MKTYIRWEGNYPVLTKDEKQCSARLVPVFGSEIKRFLAPGIQGQDDDNIYLWAQNYFYYRNGKRFLRWDKGELKWLGDDKPTEIEPVKDLLYGYPVDKAELIKKSLPVLQEREDEAIRIIREVAEKYSNLPMFVDYSGGKDSEVLLHLVMSALPADRYKVVFNDTRQELTSTYKRIEQVKNELAIKGVDFEVQDCGIEPIELWHKISPPTSNNRWCCRVYKHAGLAGAKISATGVRASESQARNGYEMIRHDGKYAGEIQFSPILEWQDLEVWLYMLWKGIEFNTAYKEGLRRVGCVCCPCGVENHEKRIDSIEPSARKPYIEAIKETVLPEVRNWKLRFGLSTIKFPFIVERSKEGNCYKWEPGKVLLKEWLKPLNEPITIEENATDVFIPKEGEKSRFAAMERALSCVYCGACAHECITGALKIDYKNKKISIDENRCVKCKACLARVCSVVRSLTRSVTLEDLLAEED